MKRVICALALLLALSSEAVAGDILTGDTRLACEAILCLSSPARPGECGPSLDRYFGIKKKKWGDTVKARRNFLNKCPTATESDVMLSLTNALSYGAGMCGADELNARGRWVTSTKRVSSSDCSRNGGNRYGYNDNQWQINRGNYRESWHWEDSGGDSGYSYCVHTVSYWQVDPNPPSYCRDLWEHENTYFIDGPKLVTGQNPWDTRWVEQK